MKSPLFVHLDVKCGKCDQCLRERAAKWSARAIQEWRASHRSWFGTLTFGPGEAAQLVSTARVNEARQGVDFDTLPDAERFRALCRVAGQDVTKWLKRVRKESGAEIRYLCVAEAHKSGMPHYHVLIHERDYNGVRHATLSTQWKAGFSKFNLVRDDSRRVAYLCKYLSKSKLARVRASLHYGDASPLCMPGIQTGRVRQPLPGNSPALPEGRGERGAKQTDSPLRKGDIQGYDHHMQYGLSQDIPYPPTSPLLPRGPVHADSQRLPNVADGRLSKPGKRQPAAGQGIRVSSSPAGASQPGKRQSAGPPAAYKARKIPFS